MTDARASALKLIAELRDLVERSDAPGHQGLDEAAIEDLEDGLGSRLCPIYAEFLAVFGARFDLLARQRCDLSTDGSSVLDEFTRGRYPALGQLLDPETGVTLDLHYDLQTPSADNLDYRLVRLDVDDSPHPYFDSLIEWLLFNVFGLVRFSHDPLGRAFYTFTLEPSAVPAIRQTLDTFAGHLDLIRLGSPISQHPCYDSDEVWLQTRTLPKTSAILLRLGAIDDRTRAIAFDQLVSLVDRALPGTTIERL